MARWTRGLGLTAPLLVAALAMAQAPEMSLEKAGARSGADFNPVEEGHEVTVRGVVSSRPLWALDSFYLAIQDQADYGLLIQTPAALIQSLQPQPGDKVVATGTIVRRAGMPVLQPKEIRKEGTQAPPQPKRLTVSDLSGFRYLGLLVTTEGTITGIANNAGGDILTIADRDSAVTIFLPKTRRNPNLNSFEHFNASDRVSVTALANQYCPLPPYDHYFQLLINDPASVQLVERGALIPPFLLLTAVVGIALILGVWWLREHRMAAQRKTMRSLNLLSEQIIAAASPAEIVKKLGAVMPQVSGASGVRLYIFNRRTRLLDRVTNPRDPEPLSINVEAPVGALPTGAALAFRNRALLNVPDTRRSPFFKTGSKELPRSVMFVPMFAQNEVMGVLEVTHSESIRYFTHEEQAATQHLANQVAASLKLQEQQSIREQLFRSEKLAATGQLISGVASELKTPLETILAISKHLAAFPEEVGTRDLQVLAAESQRASEIVARLVSFGRAEETEAKPMEINALLKNIANFRGREWKALGIDVKVRMSREPLYTVGVQGQLEQVLLNLLVHAEQTVLDAHDKTVTVVATAVGQRILLEVAYNVRDSTDVPDPLAPHASDSSSLGLGVSRGVVQSHGGDIRFSRPTQMQCRFEVDLPLSGVGEAVRTGSRQRNRQYTTMVVEPDAAQCKQIVALLSARDHRVIPVASAEEGVDLVQKLRFDAVLCSMRLPGLNWVEFFERVRPQAGAFVLLTEGHDPALTRAFSGAEGFVLAKPITEQELDRVIADVETRADQAVTASGR